MGPAQRQLVVIARAVAAEAPSLIFEEPTASLSASEAERLFAVIDRLRGRGVAALYISHRLGDLRRVAEQTKPLDFAASVQAMIGRSLGETAARPAPNRAGAPVLRLKNL